MRYDGGKDTPLRLFLGRATASFLRRHFLAAEEWFLREGDSRFGWKSRPKAWRLRAMCRRSRLCGGCLYGMRERC